MIVCEYEFEQEDPKNPGYSMVEVDFYAWVPQGMGISNHRLSLRKNLKTGEYEVYRRFFRQQIISRVRVTVITGDDTGIEQVAFRSKELAETLRFIDGEWRRFHGEGKEPDQVCQHKPPVLATFCKKWKQTSSEERLKIWQENLRQRRLHRERSLT